MHQINFQTPGWEYGAASAIIRIQETQVMGQPRFTIMIDEQVAFADLEGNDPRVDVADSIIAALPANIKAIHEQALQSTLPLAQRMLKLSKDDPKSNAPPEAT